MNKLTVFNFENNNVRTLVEDGEVWFVGKDVAEVLGYRDPSDSKKNHCKRAKSLKDIASGLRPDHLPGNTKMIQESDLYRLIMRSTLPSAEKFQDWVVEEVLPSIRKTGSYHHMIPKDYGEALQLCADQQKKIQADQHKVDFVDNYVESQGTKTLREVAKLLGHPERAFNQWLVDNKILYQQVKGAKLPYSDLVNKGYFKIKTRHYNGVIVNQTKVTGKGIEWLARKVVNIELQ